MKALLLRAESLLNYSTGYDVVIFYTSRRFPTIFALYRHLEIKIVPNLCVVVGMLGSHVINPGESDRICLKRTLRYLQDNAGIAVFIIFAQSSRLLLHDDDSSTGNREKKRRTRSSITLK